MKPITKCRAKGTTDVYVVIATYLNGKCYYNVRCSDGDWLTMFSKERFDKIFEVIYE